jgi:uracil phosphoribosyltransferase
MLSILDHPLAAHLLASLRDTDTPPAQFREIARRLTTILVLEATRDMATAEARVITPLEETRARRLASAIAAVPILRAGLAMLGPVTDLFPDVAVGYVGLERNEATAVASSYYKKLPNLKGKLTLLLDPMLATGGSAVQAVDLLKAEGAEEVRMVCVVAAPEGTALLQSKHADVRVYTAALDRELNAKKYILPGLGDFGDRLYGTL